MRSAIAVSEPGAACRSAAMTTRGEGRRPPIINGRKI
jgi:hypothetical protein